MEGPRALASVQVIGEISPIHEAVQVQAVSEMGWTPPWPWYPQILSQWGLSNAGDRVARAWFAGVPQGQERRVFEALVDAIQHRRRILSPLTEKTVAGLRSIVPIAVLTTPG